MKYIRTTDNLILETSKLSKCEDKRFPNSWFTENGVPIVVIKEADGIEKLADYLLFKFKAEKKMIGTEIEETASLSILKSFMEDGSLDFARLFVFKGKDLKCVSEMNETGKWELL